MIVFRGVLVIYLIALCVYIGTVGSSHGWDMLPIFMGDVVAVNWAGQINIEYTGYLFLLIAWLLWRNGFNIKGLVLSVLALSTSMVFLLVYLLYLSFQCRGDVKRMLVGDR